MKKMQFIKGIISQILNKSWVILVMFLLFPVSIKSQPSSDREQYRRSSLCLILLTHSDKKYAAAMERVFRSFPLPARYNEHNISSIRVISVRGKQKKRDIDNLLIKHEVAKSLVGRWFNRDSSTGFMNMDLIHDRGGYGAFYADYQRAQSQVRGTSLLRDEGIELLQSTFVLVCDMDYIDKQKGARWGALALGLLSVGSAVMAGVNQQQATEAAAQGDYSRARSKQRTANAFAGGAALGAVGTAVVADIGGFRVKMNSYLYKLMWNDELTNFMYNNYWIDANMSDDEVLRRKEKFEREKMFSLDFIGQYKATSSKTILKSWSNEDEVILDVCQRCVKKGINELAKTFVVFRPRVPFYFGGDGKVYSHVGRKEDVSYGKEYEIVQPYKDKKGQIQYKRVGKAKAGSPWNNREIRFDQYFDTDAKGTMFYCEKSNIDLHTPGLQLREI